MVVKSRGAFGAQAHDELGTHFLRAVWIMAEPLLQHQKRVECKTDLGLRIEDGFRVHIQQNDEQKRE